MGGRPLAEQMSPRTARLYRALNNHFEGLILFSIAFIVIYLSDQSTPFTLSCACFYLFARVAYMPAYAFGLTPGRSLIWFSGFSATVAILLAALL